jgi:hypothetical protein
MSSIDPRESKLDSCRKLHPQQNASLAGVQHPWTASQDWLTSVWLGLLRNIATTLFLTRSSKVVKCPMFALGWFGEFQFKADPASFMWQ